MKMKPKRNSKMQPQYIGSSYDGFFGRTTHIDDISNTLFSSQADSPSEDDVFDDSSVDDSFGSSDW